MSLRTGWVVLGLVGCAGPETGFETLEPILSVAPEILDFGEVGLPLSGTGQVFVENAGKADLTVDVTLESATGVFVLNGGPPSGGALHLEVEPGEEVPLDVVFTPDTFRDYEGRLLFTSNDEAHATWTVPIRGVGADLPLPQIEILPGNTIIVEEVGADETPILTFDIHNAGDAELVVDTLTLAGDPEFQPVVLPLVGMTIFPGDSSAVAIRYTPLVEEGSDATVTITSNDPVTPETSVILVGNGGSDFEPPVAAIDCPATVLLTGPEWVNLDGSASFDPGGTALTYEWSVLTRPPGSDGSVPIDPDDQSDADVYIDIAGVYTVQLIVWNELDAPSVPALCVLNAVPEDDIHVELSWDTPQADVDLHVAQAGFDLFSVPEDCNYCNESPNWGGAGNDDDPRIDIDDTGGWGPENINVLVPAEGDYVVRVHYYENHGDGPLVATVRVWAGGTEIAVEQRVMVEDEVWEVGTLGWPTGIFAVNPGPSTNATVVGCQ